jgi:superfamily I DNA/RNA helicase
MITSFTRAAAREIATKKSRDTELPIEVDEQNVGTLHSICYHALGTPKIMEVDYTKEWNTQHPEFAVCGHNNSSMDNVVEDGEISTKFGDSILSAINIYRNKLIPESMWWPQPRRFYKKWCDFKKNIGAVDFTELIENAITDRPYAPGRPEVLFVDEAQDFTKLQLKLARNWGAEMKWIVLVGDDDQTIYRFTGADPFAFLLPAVSNDRKTVLNQSYRVPQAVLERSLEVIERIEHREPKHYMARKENGDTGATVIGEVNDKDYSYNKPESMLKEAADYAKDDKRVMILTSCSYMLNAIKAQLKDSGTPFASPYRTSRGDWNPLASRINGVSAKDLLVAFKSCGADEPYWNVPQFLSWVQYLKACPTGLKRIKGKKGIKTLKKAVEENDPGLYSTRNVVHDLLEPEAAKAALARDVQWLQLNLTKARRTSIQYPIKVLNNFGEKHLIKQPNITIGTIHSVKGTEADIIYLFPDLSWQAVKEYDTPLGKDNIHRVFYVGMTRAKEILNIGKPASSSPYKHTKPFVKI